MKKFVLASIFVLVLAGVSRAQIVITEVDPTGSSASYAADWFELKNTGASAVDITGWKMDDNSHTFGSAVAIRGITSIAAGQSVVFIEGNATGTTDATIQANFETAWFGATVPAGFTIAGYGGTGVGLSATADEVNIFDSVGNRITGAGFGASTAGFTFDNTAGVSGTTDPLPLLTTLSVAGTNGAFLSSSGAETGSPGNVTVPEPSCLGLVGVLLLGLKRRR